MFVYCAIGIRTFLLESEEHECPDCNEKDVSPETLIPNRFLRNAVMNFKNETGYAKRQTYRQPTQINRQIDQQKPDQNISQTLNQSKPAQAPVAVSATTQENTESQTSNFESAPQQFPVNTAQPQTASKLILISL